MGKKVRIGLFGGSFDPIHCGHLELAELARNELALDRVVFIPALQPPHKKDRSLIPARHRLKMLSLAIAPYPFFSISRFELNRGETTYTYQTVEHFRERRPSADLFFILGTDSLNELGTWRHPERLVREAVIVAGKRAGSPPAAFEGRVHLLSKQIRPVSSSEIRERIAAGKPLDGLVPPAVDRYLREHRLYGAGR